MTTSPKPHKRLPENPSEENLRKQAKQLGTIRGKAAEPGASDQV